MKALAREEEFAEWTWGTKRVFIDLLPVALSKELASRQNRLEGTLALLVKSVFVEVLKKLLEIKDASGSKNHEELRTQPAGRKERPNRELTRTTRCGDLLLDEAEHPNTEWSLLGMKLKNVLKDESQANSRTRFVPVQMHALRRYMKTVYYRPYEWQNVFAWIRGRQIKYVRKTLDDRG